MYNLVRLSDDKAIKGEKCEVFSFAGEQRIDEDTNTPKVGCVVMVSNENGFLCTDPVKDILLDHREDDNVFIRIDTGKDIFDWYVGDIPYIESVLMDTNNQEVSVSLDLFDIQDIVGVAQKMFGKGVVVL